MINSALYMTLNRRFGEVRIANEDESMSARYGYDAITGRPKFSIGHMGESYRVCCPFCGDQRFRLWINHRWATREPGTMNRYMSLAKCFNEDCIAKRGWRQLENYIFNRSDVCIDLDVPIRRGISKLEEVSMPGEVRLLSDLPASHHAVKYLCQRGYDIQELSSIFKICYCSDTSNKEYNLASNRIIIPVYMKSVLVGWQARYIGDRDWHDKEFRVLKYFSIPHFRKSLVLYNYDEAIKDDGFVVVCEGPSDSWRIGPSSVALFGKSISVEQVSLIANTWQNGYVAVMLDRDAIQDSFKVALKLREKIKNVFVISPPKGFDDPGDAPRSVPWDHISKEVKNEIISRL